MVDTPIVPTHREDITVRSPIRSTRSSRLRVIAAAAVAALAGVTTLMATAGSNPTPVASAVSGTLSLGGTIFDDVNNDHHSTGDQGLNNVTVSLYNSDGQPGGHATVPPNGLPLATTSTANGGQYAFANF